MTDGPKRIQSINRAIDVIEHIAKHGESSLAELRRGTGLSNSTLLRILSTLQDRKWVRRLLAEGRYELPFSLGTTLDRSSRGLALTEVASPYLIALHKALGQPSDIAIPLAEGKMEILETTRMKGPLAPNRTVYGVRPSMVESALGRAYLAFCSETDRKKHFAQISENGTKQDRAWLNDKRLGKVLEQTRAQGFGVREPDYWAEPIDFGPDVSAIAVPVPGRDGYAVASINVIWIKEKQSVEEVVANCFEPLKSAANAVGIEYVKVPGN